MAFGFGRGLPKFDRSMWALLGSFLIQHAGFYLALPFLAIIFTQQFGLTPGQTGMILGTISLSYQVAGVIGGPLSDRIGRRIAMVAGLLLQAAGFLAFIWVRSVPGLAGAAIMVGIGGGLFAPAARAGIAVLASGDEERTTAFSARGIAANIGMSIGPLLGALLMGRPVLFFGAAAAFHAVVGLALPLFLPPGCEQGACSTGTGGAILRAFRNFPFVLFSLAAAMIWLLDAQMITALPLKVAALTGSPKAVGPLSTFNSLLIILLQVPISTWLLRRMHPMNAMAAGIALTGAGLASVAWAQGFFHLGGSVALIALGQMLYVPTIDSTVSTFARGESMGSFFGIATLVWGLGTGAGNLIGGQAVAVADRLARPSLPWFLFGGLAVSAAALAPVTDIICSSVMIKESRHCMYYHGGGFSQARLPLLGEPYKPPGHDVWEGFPVF